MSDRSVLLEEVGSVACVTINRAAEGNILTGAMRDELSQLLAALAHRAEPPLAVILTAGGQDVFLIGADPVEVIGYDAAAALEVSRRGQALADQIAAMPMPVLAAVNGLAIGGGVELLLACDLAVASTAAQFVQIETALGLVPGFGGTYRLPRRIGVARANPMTFTAAPVPAETALAWGLVVEVVPPDRLQERAWEIARQIAANDGPALRAAKSLLGSSYSDDLQVSHEAEAAAFAACAGTASLKARVGAVIEERARAREVGKASMKVIAHLSFVPGADVQAFLAIRAEEAERVWELYKEGAIRDAALRTDLKGAVLTFEAASEDEVRAHLAKFPAVKAGLFTYDLLAVGPFLSWETLFTEAKP